MRPVLKWRWPQVLHDRGFVATLLLSLAYGTVLSYLSILRHQTYNSYGFDLAEFDQILWNTARGHWLETSLAVAGSSSTSYFADHLAPVFIPLSLLYVFGSDVRILLIFQSFTVGFGALAVYQLARLRELAEFTATIIAVAYLVFPSFVYANLFDYHQETLLVLLLPLSFYFLHKRRYGLFFVAAIGMLFIKETAPVTVFMVGLYAAVRSRRPAMSLVVAAGSVAYFFLSIDVIIPYFRGAPYRYLNRYSQFGGSISDIFVNGIRNFASLFGQAGSLDYLLNLLFPFAGIVLLSPIELAVAIPVVLMNVASSYPAQIVLGNQYALPITPVLFLAAIETARKCQIWLVSGPRTVAMGPAASLGLAVLVLALTIFTTMRALPEYLAIKPFTSPGNAASLAEASALIPADASLATSNRIASHFSHRRVLRLFPPLEREGEGQSADTEYVLVNAADDRPSGLSEDHWSGTNSMQSIVEKLVDPSVYQLVYSKDGILLFKRCS